MTNVQAAVTPTAQPQLADAVAEAELRHHALREGLPRIVRVRLLPPLCASAVMHHWG